MVGPALIVALVAACGAGRPQPDDGPPIRAEEAATVLADREMVASISPSGRYLLTASDATRVENDELVSDVCVRSGERYETVNCVALPDRAVWSVSWSPAEDRVAFTHAGSQRRGERNDVVRVLEVAGLRSWPVSPVDLWLPAAPYAAWTPAGDLVYLWPDGERRYLVSTSEGPVNDSTAIDVDLPVVVEGVTVAGLGVDADGLIVTGDTEAGAIETRRWSSAGPGEVLLPAFGVTDEPLAADPVHGRVVTRFLDTHAAPPPQLRDLRGRSAVLDAGEATVWAVDLAPDGRSLAALLIGGDQASVAVYDIAEDLTPTERSITPVAARGHSRSFPAFARTDRGIVVEARTDGRPGLVMRVPEPGDS
ncbi:WD40 repeat domain-containing protein [Millisia brevis]|uniref:WD40 repeat domain-containing protein n=1 Tax=Millisia brevis TaxID=264148 RepID=UPI0012EDC5B7|nr:WD40 repeat domain-containing protein [Millisia brevis]